MRFECSFCGATIHISEGEFAMWNQGNALHCKDCKEKFDNNINQTTRVK